MNRFLLLILAEVAAHPSFTEQEHANALSIPAKILRESLKELYEQSMVVPREDGLYVTFLGRIALNKFDVEKAQASFKERTEALRTICEALRIQPSDIEHFSPMELGMTNRSFLVTAKGKEYIFRAPGEGTDQLVDRYREYSNYLALAGRGLSDVVVYHNPATGIKITEFIRGCRAPDKTCVQDLKMCMSALRNMHRSGITVEHTFDFEERILYYEQLCLQEGTEFLSDYDKCRLLARNVLDLLATLPKEECFCHIDSVPGNFLIDPAGHVTLIDWEYAGTCDPVADVAMWCLSARYNKRECDRMLRIYCEGEPTLNQKQRFYAYLALGGFMWSLWASYKASLGENYGEYGSKMLGYCRKYAKLLFEMGGETNIA